MQGETSGLAIRLLVEYVRFRGGDHAVTQLLDGLQLDGPNSRLLDEHASFSWQDKLTLLERGAEVLHDPDFAFHAGQHLMAVRVGGWFKSMLRSFGTPAAIYRRLGTVAGQISRVSRLEAELTGDQRATVRRWVPSEYPQPAADCRFTAGLLAAIPTLFGFPPADVEEVRCVCRGDPHCEYRVRWRQSRPLAPWLGLGGAIAASTLLALLPAAPEFPFYAAALFVAFAGIGWLTGLRAEDRRQLAFQHDVLREQRQALEGEFAAGMDLVAERSRAQHEVARALLRLAEAASHLGDLDEVLRQVVTVLPPLVGCNRCALWLLDEAEGVFRPVALHSPDPAGPATFQGAVAPATGDHAFSRALTSTTPLIVNEANRGLVPEFCWRVSQLRSVAFAALHSQRRPLGVMMVDLHGQEHRFSDEDLAIIGAVAGYAGVLIENAHLYTEAARRADRDPLTGLGNHGYLHQRLEVEVTRARREGTPLSVLMMDLDGFKAVNDQHGHLAGDEVLRSVAGVIRDACRHGDVVGRYGGDEFAAILIGADADDARAIGERLQTQLADHFGPARPGGAPSVGLSIGVASLSETTATATALLHAADQSLYQVKPSLPRVIPLRRVGG